MSNTIEEDGATMSCYGGPAIMPFRSIENVTIKEIREGFKAVVDIGKKIMTFAPHDFDVEVEGVSLTISGPVTDFKISDIPPIMPSNEAREDISFPIAWEEVD